MNVVWLVLLCTPAFVLVAVLRNQRQRAEARSAAAVLEVDARGVRRLLPNGRTEAVDWDEVSEVDVFTTRAGPHKAAGGAVVLYGDADRGCVVPLDRLPNSGVLDEIWRLPGFELSKLISAINADPHALDETAGRLAGFAPKPWQRTTVLWTRTSPDEERDSRPDP